MQELVVDEDAGIRLRTDDEAIEVIEEGVAILRDRRLGDAVEALCIGQRIFRA